MRPVVRATAIALAAVTTAIAGATTASSAVPVGAAYLRALACHRALDPAQRLVSVTAVMPTIPGTQLLQMRFELDSRPPAGPETAVRAGDLGHWISPSPITLGQNPHDVWIVHHPVTGLAVPADYRFRVTFRWVGAAGRTLDQVERESAGCWQPDLRPDPVVRSIDVQTIAGDATHDRYVAEIANDGLSAAVRLDVLFAASGGSSTQTTTIARLRTHTFTDVVFVGPACTGQSAPTVTVDPYNRIDVLERANDSLTATCPAASTTPS